MDPSEPSPMKMLRKTDEDSLQQEIEFNSSLIDNFTIDDDDDFFETEEQNESTKANQPIISNDSNNSNNSPANTSNNTSAKETNDTPTSPPTTPTIAPDTPAETRAERARQSFRERVRLFEDAASGFIDFDRIRELAFEGIPDAPGLRSLYWKLLLSYLPSERAMWDTVLIQKRQLYKEWVSELIIDPHKAAPADDHPLSTANESQWHLFFKDREIQEEVDKDVKRTLPHLHFFNHDPTAGSTEHYEALKRILFIYAKLNPGIRYVQGMNEILGPLYYIFALDNHPLFKNHAEADTFFCFTNLMAEIRDNFIKTLDKSSIGIQGLITRLNQLLHLKDPEVWESFEEKKLNPQFYSFRWLTLLLSQEFDLPDVLRLWDSLFADPVRFDFLLYVCCGMLILVRDQLLNGSFSDNLKLLQSYPATDIHVILSKAKEIQSDNYTPPPRSKNLPPPQAPAYMHVPASNTANTPKQPQHPAFNILPPMVIPSITSRNDPKTKVDEKGRSIVIDEDDEPIERSQIKDSTEKFLKPPKPFDADEDSDEEQSIPHPLA